MDVHIELLLGTKVQDMDGETVGRIEEFRVEDDGKSSRVESYLIGASALIDRLSAWSLVRPIARMLHARKLLTVYEVPWQDMDLSDLRRPKLRVSKRDLRHVK
jgi:sporulation protein YlmC with PRC-barrel domain